MSLVGTSGHYSDRVLLSSVLCRQCYLRGEGEDIILIIAEIFILESNALELGCIFNPSLLFRVAQSTLEFINW